MARPDHNRGCAVACLANLIASRAPSPVKAAASRLFELFHAGSLLDDEDVLEAGDALADAIADLPGTLAVQLDLLYVLHGRRPNDSRHSASAIGAVLRAKARQLGRLPIDTDFAEDHGVRLLSLAYWGGIDAWSAGSANRRQRQKRYWVDRNHQIAALLAAVAAYPGIPITHALLHKAGLHRLGQVLSARELAALADAAGIDRRLLYQPADRWTAERVIDAYAAECRRAGATLSTTALAAIGGAASSLRAYVQRHFASFDAFQRAVVVRHPDIRLPGRPTASDGMILDGWAEVVVYNALRLALPDAHIEPHVLLQAGARQSCDFVLDGRVWVEVLGVAFAEMQAPTNGHRRKYARQWVSKASCYKALGIDVVVIEPVDVYDPVRLNDRVTEIARRLGCAALPLPAPSGRQTRSKGTWDFAELCRAVLEVSGSSGAMPTFAALSAAGYGHAACLLRKPGMRARVMLALKLDDLHRKGVWTRDRVVAELVAWVRERGAYPSNAKLRRSGHATLCSARQRLWAGDADALRDAVEHRTGVELPRRRALSGSLDTVAQIAAALAPLARRLGRMPSGREAAAAGLTTAWCRASRREGVVAVAARIGVPCHAPRRWTEAEMLDEFAKLSVSSGAKLTTAAVRAALGSGGIARLRRCGGIAAVRAAIAKAGRGGGQSV